ncbi:hypothetical protein PS619_03038 [Pseudomonas fluorescens]|jgi:hypothetical protein|nr:hypothetical protein PS619_03038 [Pseudomonas fluorescens]
MNTEDKIVYPLAAPLTMEWEKDKIAITEAAQQPTTADRYYFHAASIQNLFNILTFGTRSAPKHPQRSGLLRKVHDELFPIANFAKLYFSESKEVLIQWVDGNQNYDATVEYLAENLGFPDIRYLEVTTLQGSEDAKQLEELSEGNNITTISESDHETHVRKINLFETALKKKSGKTYPSKTALLVYTDEERFLKCYFGLQPPKIDKPKDYAAVLEKLSDSLTGFSQVIVYSKSDIYCIWTPQSIAGE